MSPVFNEPMGNQSYCIWERSMPFEYCGKHRRRQKKSQSDPRGIDRCQNFAHEWSFRVKNQFKLKRRTRVTQNTDPSFDPLYFKKGHFNLKTIFLEPFYKRCKLVPQKMKTLGMQWANQKTVSESGLEHTTWRSFQSVSFSFGEHVKQQGVANTENLLKILRFCLPHRPLYWTTNSTINRISKK